MQLSIFKFTATAVFHRNQDSTDFIRSHFTPTRTLHSHFENSYLFSNGGLKWTRTIDDLLYIFLRKYVSVRLSSPIFALLKIVIYFQMVGSNGLEPSTSRLSGVCSNQLSYEPVFPRLFQRVVEINGFEPLTPCLQGRCSSQLSYTPMPFALYRAFRSCLLSFSLRSLFGLPQ